MVQTLPVRTAPTKPSDLAAIGTWPLVRKAAVRQSNVARPDVKYLQVALNALGFTDYQNRPLAVDGQPGARTMSANAKMQQAAGLATEPKYVGPWTWVVIDQAMYTAGSPAYVGWTPAKLTTTSARVVYKPGTNIILYRNPEPRTAAIYKGHNRYTGLPVDSRGIIRENAYHSDVGRLLNPSWGDPFVAVDRKTSGGGVSVHRHGGARDWMADLDKDGNYKEASEIAKCDALADYLAGTAMGWPMQTVTVRERGDYANGINDTSVPLRTRTYRFSGWLRLAQIVWNGEVFQWRFVDGQWRLQWWPLKPTSDQHRNHVHSHVAPIVGGVLL